MESSGLSSLGKKMSILNLFFLGPPRIEQSGRPIKVDTQKAVALLAYLAVTGRKQRRDWLINMLWPDHGQTRGRALLRQNLYNLNKAIGGDSLVVERETVGLNLDADIGLDVREFQELLAGCRRHGHSPSQVCPSCLSPLADAVELYRGDFLSGFSLKDSSNFDDWQFFQSKNLRRDLAGALQRLVGYHGSHGELDPAIGYAQRWLSLDRLHERAHYHLIQLYAWAGERSAAIGQYEELERILKERLGVSPQEETKRLYEAIMENRAPMPQLGHRLREGGASSGPQAFSTTLEEESRVATVLFVEMDGPLNRVGGLQPEDEVSYVKSFLSLVGGVLSKYGGQMDRAMGRSVLALFGERQTRENDPELAIRAAMEIQEESRKIGLVLTSGINTGGIYFSGAASEEHRESALMGAVIDLAMRLAEKAATGKILVGESTYRHTRSAFEFTPLSLRVKGTDGPVTAYRVERLLPQPKKARGIEGLRSKMVGREREFEALKEAAQKWLGGEGQIVTVAGEAGIGKSRLVAELKAYLQSKSQIRNLKSQIPNPKSQILWLEGRCLELGMAASYRPFIDIYRDYFAWGPREDESTRAERVVSSLREMVGRGDLPQERFDEMVPILGNLLSLRFGNHWDKSLRNLSPTEVKHRTFVAVRDFFLALAKSRPIMLVFEDLHWSDGLSLDLISFLMQALPLAPLFLLCVYRPEGGNRCEHLSTMASQKHPEHCAEFHLRELTPRQSRQLVDSLLTVDGLPSSVRALILEKSQGNPFFVEEVIRSLIDSEMAYREGGSWRVKKEIESMAVPESIQSIILSRVDHLDGNLKGVLQSASVIGRLFRRRVLERLARKEIELESALLELSDRALIYKEKSVPDEEYSFKHFLTQEAIYQNIPRSRRRAFHKEVGEAMEALYGDNLDEHYEEMAYHYSRSEDVEKALTYLLKAGEKAKRRSANEEAISYFQKGLELLEGLPKDLKRTQNELDFLVSLGPALRAAKGHSAPEVEVTYTRALELCQEMGEASQLFAVLRGLLEVHMRRGEPKTTLEWGKKLLGLAQSTQDTSLLLEAHLAVGQSLSHLGELSSALEHLERARVLYDPLKHRSMAFLYGADQGVTCLHNEGWVLWLLGYPDRAIRRCDEAIALARELSHPFSLAAALLRAALVHHARGDEEEFGERVEELIKLSTEQNFPFYLACGTGMQGFELVRQGRKEEGFDRMNQTLAAFRATRSERAALGTLGWLAQAYRIAYRTKEGLRVVEEGLAMAEKIEQPLDKGQLYRIKGELLEQQAAADGQNGEVESEAEACYLKALEIARQSGLKPLELRASMNLSRLWYKKGKKEEARKMLAEIYFWFTEGFDTRYLKEAKALLEELS